MDAPTTIDFPEPLAVTGRRGDRWNVVVGGRELSVSNLDKLLWEPEGYTKADLLTYYANAAPYVLPVVAGRPLTLKRMPGGADGEAFYAKRVPDHAPAWLPRAPVVSLSDGDRIDYLLATEPAALVYTANLASIELHPWHSRVDDIGHPDYAFFDLDPMEVGFDVVREIALLVRTVLDGLELRGYPRTSGATGMQVYVPLDRVHTAGQVTAFVTAACRLIARADPDRTTMTFTIADRGRRVYLDAAMNREGRTIAATYCPRPVRAACVATPVTWDEVESGIVPTDFTIATVLDRVARVGDLFAPVLAGGQDLRAGMRALGLDPEAAEPPRHVLAEAPSAPDAGKDLVPAGDEPGELATYRGMRDFARTPEPDDAPDDEPGDEPGGAPGDAPSAEAPAAEAAAAATADREVWRADDPDAGRRFVIQHHLATRLHHDVRLERGGTLRSWAVPKGLPDVPGIRHMAVQTEDHPLSYGTFSGEIPAGEYGGGPVRIWDTGSYEALEWTPDKVTFRLHGRRHVGEWHLFRTGGRDGDGRGGEWMVVRRGAGEPWPDEPPPPAPMLATTGEGPFDDPAWLFEVKWDGVRAIAVVRRPGGGPPPGTALGSRQGNDLSGAYPELASLWERVLARTAVLDGEVVALDPQGRPSFQRLQQRMHLREPRAVERAARTAPVVYMVFDLLALDGRDLTGLPLVERVALLDEVLVPGRSVQRSTPIPGTGTALYAAAEQQGLEGIMAKRADSPYRPGRRTRDWLKLKVRRRRVCAVAGWLPGEGGLAGELGSLLVALPDEEGVLRYAGRVGTGFDVAERRRVRDLLEPLAVDAAQVEVPSDAGPEVRRSARWVRPQLACTVEYAEVTEGGRLRAPSYRGMADPADVEPLVPRTAPR